MVCTYCNSEMEKGRFVATASTIVGVPVTILGWYSQEEFEKKGLASFKRKGISVKDSKDGYDSYYCQQCKKVFAEFPTE